ncbi:hypothetical protein HHK36_029506 [Tetracentron sinense]|uniref:Uncharacterized protein n=1 Tax=Tetracentron sinense TaxID=13715 RepID=A0A834YBF2_TETSI|nr:hypothetical protein HHK36_029506 [Tetracentron sinense]
MWNRVPHSFLSQIDWFNKFIQEVDCKGKDGSACKAEMENALFWIGEMGVNDYSRTFGSSFSTQLLMEMAVNNVCRLLKPRIVYQAMLFKGAKYIVVQGLPPTGCLPLDLSACSSSDRDDVGCSASANAVIKAHNDLLQSKLAKLQEQFSGCSIIYADYWSAYRTILKKWKEYQFEEPYKACCGAGDNKLNFDAQSICGSPSTSKCAEPSKYINWDGVHLTEAMHEKLADLFFNQGFCRPSFDQMINAKLSA